MDDFTLSKYSELCKCVVNSDYNLLTVSEYISSGMPKFSIILRHDVDSNPQKALRMAQLEANMGISSTYYFRYVDKVFDPKTIQDIVSLGHEVGYHYETLSKVKGDHKKGIELFENELSKFRDICEINTISMHGSSLSKYDNRSLWESYDFQDYDLIGEAYLSVGSNFSYFSDTGRSWDPKQKLRDWIPGKSENYAVRSTSDLIELIKNNEVESFYVLAHPPIWGANKSEIYRSILKNKIFNVGKKALRIIYKFI